MSLKPLDLDTAGTILDFSGGDPALKSLGKLQLEGAVALHSEHLQTSLGGTASAYTNSITHHCLATGLTHQTIVRCAIALAENFSDTADAIDCRPFFITGQQNPELALMVWMITNK